MLSSDVQPADGVISTTEAGTERLRREEQSAKASFSIFTAVIGRLICFRFWHERKSPVPITPSSVTLDSPYSPPPATILAPAMSISARMPSVALPLMSRPAIIRSVRRSSPLSGPANVMLEYLYLSSPIRVDKKPGSPSTTAEEVVKRSSSPSASPFLFVAYGVRQYEVLGDSPSIRSL